MTEGTDPYIDEDLFPVLEGTRMCPRCRCCAVGVGPYTPPKEIDCGMLRSVQYIPLTSSLVPEPSAEGLEAWYCKGGCDQRGKHVKRWPEQSPSFIGLVKNHASKKE